LIKRTDREVQYIIGYNFLQKKIKKVAKKFAYGEGGFTDIEKQQLQGALYDIADRIRRAASTITQ